MSDIDAILDAAAANATFDRMAAQIEAALAGRTDFDAQRAMRYISIIRDRIENAKDKETCDRIEECARYALRLGLILGQ